MEVLSAEAEPWSKTNRSLCVDDNCSQLHRMHFTAGLLGSVDETAVLVEEVKRRGAVLWQQQVTVTCSGAHELEPLAAAHRSAQGHGEGELGLGRHDAACQPLEVPDRMTLAYESEGDAAIGVVG